MTAVFKQTCRFHAIPRLILAFTLLGPIGCSAWPFRPAVSRGEKHMFAFPDLNGNLSRQLHVRVEAASLHELVAKVRPDFVWAEPDEDNTRGTGIRRDFLWVSHDPNGRPHFRMERAFTWRPPNQPTRWILVDYVAEPYDGSFVQFAGKPLPADLTVSEQIPVSDSPSDYAVVLSSHGDLTLYELGWAPTTYSGSGGIQVLRRTYVLIDGNGKDRLVGEGVSTEQGRSGGSTCYDEDCQTSVEWTGDPAAPVRITFRVCHYDAEACEEPIGLPTLRVWDDYILSGTLPAPPPVKVTKRPYWIVQQDNENESENEKTLLDIAFKIACWHTGREKLPSRGANIVTALANELARLNPGLSPDKPLPAGTKVDLPTQSEFDQVRSADRAATHLQSPPPVLQFPR